MVSRCYIYKFPFTTNPNYFCWHFSKECKNTNTGSQSQIGKQIKLCFLDFTKYFCLLIDFQVWCHVMDLLGIIKLHENSNFNFIKCLCTFLFKFLIDHYATELYWQLYIMKWLIMSLITNNYQITMTDFHGNSWVLIKDHINHKSYFCLAVGRSTPKISCFI